MSIVSFSTLICYEGVCFMPRCACTQRAYGNVLVCVCVCLSVLRSYICSDSGNQVQVNDYTPCFLDLKFGRFVK